MKIADWLIDLLHWFPNWFIILFISMIPFIELRGAIPIGLATTHGGFGMSLWEVFPLAILGNLIPIPFILIYFERIEKFLRRYKLFDKFFDFLFKRTRKRANAKIKKYEAIGVVFFVAIPLPFTGAWTGSLIAYLFELEFKKAFLCIALGVIIAGIIVTIAVKFFDFMI